MNTKGTLLTLTTLSVAVGGAAAFFTFNAEARFWECPAMKNVRQARKDLTTIETGLKTFLARNGSYPEALEELVPGMLKNIPKDPWGNDYAYEFTAGRVVITSFGLDGVPGGNGENKDIASGLTF